ncbi:MAG: HIT family protein [uncultured Sulfurovum sp.]|uniref:HIT family protein n=1 Tax=uncultured Sulfurovum sp. TaxID=269237 RepID=A0A6S6SR76_9BACT|nr:MAG: HIT family protein [uncultured Sulfurovum sp.]
MCIFCKIVNNEIPSNKLLENDDFIAFHDLHPKAPIHVLVVPKNHVDCFQDVSAEMMAKMTLFVQEVTRLTGIDKTGYRLITNNGDDGGQEVHHLHFHVMGGAKLPFGHLSDEPHKNM